MENCMKGGCPQKDADTCPSCVHWTPSRGSKYARCAQFLSAKVLCWLPEGSCGTCTYRIPEGALPRGRENQTGVDWSDPLQVAEHRKLKKLQMAVLPPKCSVPKCAAEPRHFHVSLYGGKTSGHLCRAHYTVHGGK